MDYNFKKFTQTKSSFVPKVTIRKGGYLGISQAAASRYGIDGAGYCGVFYYDKDACVIGVQITKDDKEPGAVKIQWRKNGDNAVIQASIRSFLEYNQIDYSDTISYTPEWDENHQMIIIDLNKPKESKTRQRKKTIEEAINEEASEVVRTSADPSPPSTAVDDSFWDAEGEEKPMPPPPPSQDCPFG